MNSVRIDGPGIKIPPKIDTRSDWEIVRDATQLPGETITPTVAWDRYFANCQKACSQVWADHTKTLQASDPPVITHNNEIAQTSDYW